jgi:hypothetical protein
MEKTRGLSADTVRQMMIEAGVPADDLRNLPAGEPVWDTKGLTDDFEVLGFLAPFVVVKRRSDGQKGTLEFTHRPRVYFDFVADKSP